MNTVKMSLLAVLCVALIVTLAACGSGKNHAENEENNGGRMGSTVTNGASGSLGTGGAGETGTGANGGTDIGADIDADGDGLLDDAADALDDMGRAISGDGNAANVG